MVIGNRLGEVLSQQGKRQVWLVSETGINKTTISKIINQKYEPSVSMALQIAGVLNTSVENIFSDIYNKKPNGDIKAYKLNSVILIDSSFTEEEIKKQLWKSTIIKFGSIDIEKI